MSRSRPFSVASVISTTGILCFPLFQLVLSDLPCEENEMCVNYDQHLSDWYIWFLLLIFLVALLSGAVFFCLQCWLKRSRTDSQSRTLAIFAVGDLDPIYGTDAAVSPVVGIHLHTPSSELCPAPCFGTLGPPPPYEAGFRSGS
ncbi:transmembrane protein 207 [Carlito syrichta]|uniref:Transmembrane protein 207 n=1 Tax=Carlito syrichta TaxID=1868482 RepID=A0A1U7UV32_CARSF|nr:transmembrane protein 207 [Carlito syrichta]